MAEHGQTQGPGWIFHSPENARRSPGATFLSNPDAQRSADKRPKPGRPTVLRESPRPIAKHCLTLSGPVLNRCVPLFDSCPSPNTRQLRVCGADIKTAQHASKKGPKGSSSVSNRRVQGSHVWHQATRRLGQRFICARRSLGGACREFAAVRLRARSTLHVGPRRLCSFGERGMYLAATWQQHASDMAVSSKPHWHGSLEGTAPAAALQRHHIVEYSKSNIMTAALIGLRWHPGSSLTGPECNFVPSG